MPLSNVRIGQCLQLLLAWVPFVFVLARWVVFWVLDSAIIQFHEDSSGQKMREESLKRSKAYVEKTAPGENIELNVSYGGRKLISNSKLPLDAESGVCFRVQSKLVHRKHQNRVDTL